MTHWDAWQWNIYSLLQYSTAISYFLIPGFLSILAYDSRKRGFDYHSLTLKDSRLFRAFIIACGMHHLTHPIFMQQDWFIMITLVDLVMAIVSVWTAGHVLMEIVNLRDRGHAP